MKGSSRQAPSRQRRSNHATERLLLRVAHLYYVENLTQDLIAPQVGVSRSRVSRLLKEARARGYVSIHIRHPTIHADVEHRLEEAFGLREAVVVVGSGNELKPSLGMAAAEYLDKILRSELVLGIAWGSTIGQVVGALRPRVVPGLKVVQMTGSIYEPPISAGELTSGVAAALGGRAYLLHAPAVVDSPDVQRAILSDSEIRRVFELHQHIDVALFGVGALQPVVSSSLIGPGFLSTNDVRTLRRAGVVADVCSAFLQASGSVFRGAVAGRVIAISPQDLTGTALKIAVAGGAQKALAIAAACRAGMVDVLVTDDGAAKAMLAAPTLSGGKRDGAKPGGR